MKQTIKCLSKICCVAIFCFSVNTFSQSVHHEKKILQKVNRFFKGLNTKDTTLIQSTFAGEVGLKNLAIKGDEELLITEDIAEFLNQIGRLSDDIQIREEIENISINLRFPLADVFTDYVFFVNDEKSHSGINLFTFVYTEEEWKIVNIVDTRK